MYIQARLVQVPVKIYYTAPFTPKGPAPETNLPCRIRSPPRLSGRSGEPVSCCIPQAQRTIGVTCVLCVSACRLRGPESRVCPVRNYGLRGYGISEGFSPCGRGGSLISEVGMRCLHTWLTGVVECVVLDTWSWTLFN